MSRSLARSYAIVTLGLSASPARTFMNLLDVPVLLYVACLLMLVTRRCDRAFVLLATTFLATRAVHAVVYIGVNHVPARFACNVAG